MPTKLFGTYIYPLRFFGEHLLGSTPDAAREVIREIQVGDYLVYVTRGGGLFAEREEGLNYDGMLAFNENLTKTFNRLICEFTLAAIVVSDSVSPEYIEPAELKAGHAAIVSAGGGRETYSERSLAPEILLRQSSWQVHWTRVDESVLNQIAPLSITGNLPQQMLGTAPAFIAGAYSHYSRKRMAEAIIDAFVFLEQFINHYWGENITSCQRHIANLPTDQKRTIRKNSVYDRINILQAIGCFNPVQASCFHQARHHRNEVAHSANVGSTSAEETMNALKAALDLVCGVAVA